MLLKEATTFAIAVGTAVTTLVIGAGAIVFSEPAAATVQFAKETGKACGDCHTSAKGGGPLTPMGTQFKAAGNKMPAKP